MDQSPPLTDDELHALVDDQLEASQRNALHRRLAHDPMAQAKVQQWRAQRAQLRNLHTGLLEQDAPPHLKAAIQQFGMRQQRTARLIRWGGVAASVMLSFAAGWWTHGLAPNATVAGVQSARAPVSEFVRQASQAYAVYAPEVRHPVEVSAGEQVHLLQWLSKRLGRPVKAPDLSGHGLELVGGRLLPGDTGARAQFMYQSPAGVRITLYLGGIAGQTAASARLPERGETAFQFSADGATSNFYWVDQGFGYALSGQVQRETLLQLARAVYQQL